MPEPKETDPLLSRKSSQLLPGSDELQTKLQSQLWETWAYWSSVVGFCALWVGFGVFYLMEFGDLHIIQALYVTVEIATTIGFGDFETDDIRGFLCVYVFGSVILLAYILNHYSDMLVHSTQNIFQGHLRRLEASRQGDTQTHIAKLYGKLNDFIVASLLFIIIALIGTTFFRIYEGCTCLKSGTHIEGCDKSHCSETGGTMLPFTSSLYMCIATMTTVGFGDRHPETRMGELFAIFFMIIGVAASANFVRAVSHFFLDQREHIRLQEKITRNMFEEIDRDHDGTMSKGEFRRFVLTHFNLVDASILDEIDRQYAALAGDHDDAGRDASQRGLTFEQIAQRYDDVQEWQKTHPDADA